MRVLWPMGKPIEMTEPSSTMAPSTTSERAPMEQLSSVMVGAACSALECAADAAAARQVHVLADLRAGVQSSSTITPTPYLSPTTSPQGAARVMKKYSAVSGSTSPQTQTHARLVVVPGGNSRSPYVGQ